jgi:hypothetical protein
MRGTRDPSARARFWDGGCRAQATSVKTPILASALAPTLFLTRSANLVLDETEGRRAMLTAHQRVAVLRAFPQATIDDHRIRIGRWTFAVRGGRPSLPEAEGPFGRRYFDGADEAMTLWSRLCEMLGCA